MDAEMLEKYRKAGDILARIRDEASSMIDVGVSILEVANYVEETTRDLGGEPAFPCNISRDRVAAHDTPRPQDESVFGEEMVKLDIGVHVDGYIADSAVSVDLGGHPDLVEASRAGLAAAIELVEPGVDTAELGGAIEDAINGYGYSSVANLTGHGLSRYQAHGEPSIPNRAIEKGVLLSAGDVIAIEPFATDGVGRISEAREAEIFSLVAKRPVRSPPARALLKQVQENYSTLPFARRWLSGDRIDYAIGQLLRAGVLRRYPLLWEAEGALVSQAEHTVIVTESGREVTTEAR
ncbi:type II methionyl aminopeptidase [Methanocrinis sp.]|uniref:type II methionyl aminopeptidase n=1 Tax=Methanocrinis sp. TaxID=3101522 RepID=UPI003D143EAB